VPSITLHEVATSGQLVGVECEHCMRHALLSKEQLKAQAGDKRTLEEAGLYCSKCRSRRFTTMRFKTRSAAHAFMRNV
jgi:DNA-directed RNA polymerase subunit RPC12/RpoP